MSSPATRVALFAGVTLAVSCCVLSFASSVFLALLTGDRGVPQPYHVLIGLVIGLALSIIPTALVAWAASCRDRPATP